MSNLFSYSKDEAYDLSLIIEKSDLEKRFIERYDVLESNIEITRDIKKAAVKDKSKDNIILWNIFGYFNILAYDLISVGYNLVFENKQWQKIYYARQVVLIIYEGLQDIPEILGKYYKEIFKDISNAEKYVDEMNYYKKEFELFKKNNVKYLYDIRICVSAHRDQDIDKQLEVICKIDPDKVKDLMLEFEQIIRKISDHLQKLLVHTVQVKE